MSDLSKILIYGIAYSVNKEPFNFGMALLKKENKTNEEEIAARSFKRLITCIGFSFGFSILFLIMTTINFMISISLENISSEYVSFSMLILFATMILSPILMVTSVILPRTSFGKDWINYYNSIEK